MRPDPPGPVQMEDSPALRELREQMARNQLRRPFARAPGPVHVYSQEDFGPGTYCPGCRRQLPRQPLPESNLARCGLCGRPFSTLQEIWKFVIVLAALVAIILLMAGCKPESTQTVVKDNRFILDTNSTLPLVVLRVRDLTNVIAVSNYIRALSKQ